MSAAPSSLQVPRQLMETDDDSSEFKQGQTEVGGVSVTLQTIAASKLLNYVQKDALVAFLTPPRYTELEAKLKADLNKVRVNLKDIKRYLVTRPDVMAALRKDQAGVNARSVIASFKYRATLAATMTCTCASTTRREPRRMSTNRRRTTSIGKERSRTGSRLFNESSESRFNIRLCLRMTLNACCKRNTLNWVKRHIFKSMCPSASYASCGNNLIYQH